MIKLVTAVIKPHMLESGQGQPPRSGRPRADRRRGTGLRPPGRPTETYRGAEYTVDLVPKLRIDVLCGVEDAEKVVETIRSAAHSGKIGDGKNWIVDVDRVMRIRTGEMGSEAL